jgi:hypothetical protein
MEMSRVIDLLGIRRHERLQTLLSSYVDAQVTPAEAARVESHLTGCEECQRDLDNMRATVGLLRAMPELQPSRSFYLTAEPEPIRRSWAVQWGGTLATAAAAAVFITLIAGDMTGLFEQTGLGVRNEATSDASTAVQAELAVTADDAADAPVMAAAAIAEPETESVAAPQAASASAQDDSASSAEAPASADMGEPDTESAAAPQVASVSAQDEGSDDSASDDEAPTSAGAATMAAPAPAVATLAEPVEESAVEVQATKELVRQEEPMEGADLMPYAGSETAEVDSTIDVEKALSKSNIESLETSDTSADTPAAAVTSSDGDDVPASDDAAVPQQLEYGTAAQIETIAEIGDEDDTAIELPLRQLQIAAGAMLAAFVAATLGMLVRRRRTL